MKGDATSVGAAGWRIEPAGGIWLARSDLLLEIPGIAHAFSTRRADHADWPRGCDMGSAEDARPELERRRRRLCCAAGLIDAAPVILRQRHGARIVDVVELLQAETPEADAVISRRGEAGGRTAAVRTADCVPILLADRTGGVVAAVHAGWRGIVERIVLGVVERLERLGYPPQELRAALGPRAARCCYEVGAEVAEAVARASEVSADRLTSRADGTRIRLDLAAALTHQLCAAGLEPRSVTSAPWCTICYSDLFFSYRREGVRAGRSMAVIGWNHR